MEVKNAMEVKNVMEAKNAMETRNVKNVKNVTEAKSIVMNVAMNVAMNVTIKRALALLLSIVMLIAIMPAITVHAAGKVIPADGTRVLVGVQENIERVGGGLNDDNRIITHSGSQSGYLLENFRSNYSISFLIDVQEAGYYEFYVRMAIGTANTYGRYRIDILNSVTNAEINTVTFNEMLANGVWNNSFVESRVPLYLEAGEQKLRLVNIHTQPFNVDGIAINRYFPPVIRDDGMPVTIEAENFISGVRTNAQRFSTLNNQTQASNGWYVGNFDGGHSVTYKVNALTTGNYEFGLWLSSPNNGMQFAVSGDGKTVTSESINSTGAWNTYQENKVVLALSAGEQDITISNLNATWNLDRFTMRFMAEEGQLYDVAPYANATGATTGDAGSLIDGNAETGWQATGSVGQSVVIRYNTPVSIDTVVLSDYPMSHITSGKLTFSNGKSFPVGEFVGGAPGVAASADILCEQEDVYWVRFDILSVDGSTVNAGLRQMKLMGQVDVNSPRRDVVMDGTVHTGAGLVYMKDVLTGFAINNGRINLTLLKEEAFDELQITGMPAGTFGATLSLNNGVGKMFDVSVNDDGFASINLGGVYYATSISISFAGITELVDRYLLGVSVIGPSASGLPQYRDYHDIYIFVRTWDNLGQDSYLVLRNDQLQYQGISSEDTSASSWTMLANENGEYTIQNEDGRYIALTSSSNNISAVTTLPTNDGGLWTFQAAPSPYVRIVNKAYPTRKINIESLDGVATARTDVSDSWYSAMWQFKTSLPPQPWEHWYEIGKNSIIGTAGTAIATSDTSIMSNASGSTRTWTQIPAYDPMQYPQFTSDNTMANAVYNLTMQEVYQASTTGVLLTGVSWQTVWTRDTAMSVHSSLGWVVPGISATSLRTKVVGSATPTNENYPQTLQQDTGTGGSYPMSDDKILIMVAMWEHYLATGNTTELSHFYDLTCNTFEQDDHIVYDPKTGLFKGETGGLDHRAKTYPNWMAESTADGVINIAEGKAAIVNVVYAHAMKLLGKSALILGKGQTVADEWFSRSEALTKAINDQLWLPERGMYASWQYPEYMGNVNADKVDVISNGYAVLFDIAPPERAESILENYPLVVYGAPTVWPQKNRAEPEGDLIYHNKGVWPGWEVTLMMGAKEKGHNQVAEEIWKSTVRAAAMSLTNKEVVNYSTGEGIRSDRQLWSVAGTLSGYYRVLFGMVYDEDGVTFDPYVPEWLAGTSTLRNYTYRNSVLTLNLTGQGDTLTSLKVDGVDVPLDYKFPANSTGNHIIDMTVTDSGRRDEVNIKPISWILCPQLPVLTLSGGALTWTPDSRYTYKLWNGYEFIDVTGISSYPVNTNKFGIYSLVATAENGVTSEMSKPVIITNAADAIMVEAEDGSYTSGTFGNTTGSNRTGFSGTGYVVDSRATTANMTFNVTIPEGKGGVYLFSTRYSNPGSGDALSNNTCGIRSFYVDGVDTGTFMMPVQQTSTVGGWGRSSYHKVYLTAGEHVIKVFRDTANWYDRNMNITSNNVVYDYFTLQYVEAFDANKVTFVIDLEGGGGSEGGGGEGGSGEGGSGGAGAGAGVGAGVGAASGAAGVTVEVRDSGNNLMEAAVTSGLIYSLPPGNYTYAVSCDGYNSKTGSFATTGADMFIPVTLEKAPFFAVVKINVSGGEAKAEYTVLNNTSDETPCQFILAVYNEDLRLVSVTTKDVVSDQESVIEELTAALPTGYTAKGFIWNALTFAPLCASAETKAD